MMVIILAPRDDRAAMAERKMEAIAGVGNVKNAMPGASAATPTPNKQLRASSAEAKARLFYARAPRF